LPEQERVLAAVKAKVLRQREQPLIQNEKRSSVGDVIDYLFRAKDRLYSVQIETRGLGGDRPSGKGQRRAV
jgi:hypothetical protein